MLSFLPGACGFARSGRSAQVQPLISLVGVRTNFDQSRGKLIKQCGQPVAICNGEHLEADAIGLQPQPVEGFFDLAETNLAELTAFDEMALVLVPMAASQQEQPHPSPARPAKP